MLVGLPVESVDDVVSGVVVGGTPVAGRYIKRACDVMLAIRCHINLYNDAKLKWLIPFNEGKSFIHSITLVQKKTINHETMV